MGNFHGITNRLDVGGSCSRFWTKKRCYTRPQEVTHLFRSMKRILGWNLFYLSRKTGSNKTWNGFQFPFLIIILKNCLLMTQWWYLIYWYLPWQDITVLVNSLHSIPWNTVNKIPSQKTDYLNAVSWRPVSPWSLSVTSKSPPVSTKNSYHW